MYRKFAKSIYYIFKDETGIEHYISNPLDQLTVPVEELYELTTPIESLKYSDERKLVTDIIMAYPQINRFIIETMLHYDIVIRCSIIEDKLILADHYDKFTIGLPLIDLKYFLLINNCLVNQKLDLDTSIENKIDAIAKLLRVDYIDMDEDEYNDDDEPNKFYIGFHKQSGYPSITIYPTRLEVCSDDLDSRPYTFLKFWNKINVKGKSREYLINKLYEIIRDKKFTVMNNYKLDGYLL